MGKYDAAIDRWFKKFEQSVAKNGERMLVDKMKVVLQEDYYDQYDPIYYKRTGNFKKSFVPYLEDLEGGIMTTASEMDEYYQSEGTQDPYNKQLIFELNMEGWHGKEKKISPYESIKRFSQSTEFLSQVYGAAVKEAGKLF